MLSRSPGQPPPPSGSFSPDDLALLRRQPRVFGAYRVVEKIAGGGMAEIFRVEAADGRSGPLALKLIRADRSDDHEFRQMLIDEAKIASRLTHPNIARVIELHDADGELGLILQYVDGIDLIRAERILRDRRTALAPDAAVLLLLEALDALEFAHNVRDDAGELLNVVHRDVSPGNIMIDLDGRIRIVDWGIARARNRMAHTEAGHVKGKFRYMAPEQITGQGVGPPTDLYSLAVTFWEILAGHRIYDDEDLPQLMMRVSKGDLPSLESARAGLPKGLHTVYKKATARDPAKRYKSARAFAEALEGLGVLEDEDAAREKLREVALAARLTDQRRGYERAVRKVRNAPHAQELEGALLRALEEPDRVELIEVNSGKMLHADTLSADTNAYPTRDPLPVKVSPAL